MATLDEILSNYERLCVYCDRFFDRVMNRHPGEMKCAPGCCSCCTLETVTALEGYVIRRYLQNIRPVLSPESGRCVFLNPGRCAIYPVRPVICRTHGLVLKNSLDLTISRSCELNFTGSPWQELPAEDLLDSGAVTENLMRLNMAYCILTGIDFKKHSRIELYEMIVSKVV